MSSSTDVAGRPSPWAPFRYHAFTLLWTAALISNVGTWMHEVGAGWLMTTLSPSPGVVALVQAATTLPVFLFALFAGALADRLDKRKMLIVINVLMLAVALALAVLVQAGAMTPVLLIVFTFLIGTGAAFMAPAWQAVVPALVPRDTLQPAIALNSMGINISRAIGPALAGVLIASVGLASPFFVNALSFIAIIAALVLWRPEASAKKATQQPILAAMATGLRHVRHNPPMRATLVRALAFFFFASAYWALLPLVARSIPGGGAELYGILLTLVGAGAVGGALILPGLRARYDANTTAAAGILGTGVAILLMASAWRAEMAMAGSLLGGLAWITVLTTFHVSAQTALPNWVRARGLSVFLMVFFGSMALGATVWGQIASLTSPMVSMLLAAAGLIIGLPFVQRYRLGQAEGLDLTPASLWPAAPIVAEDDGAHSDKGPVMVTIEYDVSPLQVTAFLEAIHALSGERLRDGAYGWQVYRSVEDEGRWIEAFWLTSWQDHLDQHDRATEEDAHLRDSVRAFDQNGAPRIRHFIAP
ncbi:MAG: MFS transporter [Pseudomonadota bacterium]